MAPGNGNNADDTARPSNAMERFGFIWEDMCDKKDNFVLGRHVVCIIDVLGQSDKLRQWKDLPVTDQPPPEFIKAVGQSLGTVLDLRIEFLKFLKEFEVHDSPAKLGILNKQQQDRYWSVRRRVDCNVKVERFSDSFVFSCPIGNTDSNASVIPVYSIMTTCCMAMLRTLAKKVPVRGAICIGTGTECDDGSFYGPALAEAHHLEAEVAGHPRIVVSPTVCELLGNRAGYSTDKVVNAIMEKMARICRSLIFEDVDGTPAIDFLGQGCRSIWEELNAELLGRVKKARDFVRSEALRFRRKGNEGNVKLALRYYILQQYIESRLPVWEIARD